ncbi:MAG TPA: hypothetical protein VEK38_04350 [Candidatus Bathyarchaeia archaeon]|nr:hypothetical protein [Candidatus Bathyarchaeia archaeon]
MHLYRLFLLTFFAHYTAFLSAGARSPAAAISYQRHPGSFGDNVMNYCQAKYLAFCYDLDFLCKPFPQSHLLALDTQEQYYYNKKNIKQFSKTRCVSDMHDIATICKKPTLYITDYHVAFQEPIPATLHAPYRYMLDTTVIEDSTYFVHHLYTENLTFAIMNNASFRAELVTKMTPTIPVVLPTLPSNPAALTVAVHMQGSKESSRTSRQLYQNFPYTMEKKHDALPSYYDEPAYTLSMLQKDQRKKLFLQLDKKYPLEFPPDQYYIDQILFLSSLLHDVPLTVYLFTDHQEPQTVRDRFAANIKKQNITILTHKNDDHSCIDDLCFMATFKCIIRGASNSARIAQFIGNPDIVIYPQHCIWINDCLIIDEVVLLLQSGEVLERHVFYQG